MRFFFRRNPWRRNEMMWRQPGGGTMYRISSLGWLIAALKSFAGGLLHTSQTCFELDLSTAPGMARILRISCWAITFILHLWVVWLYGPEILVRKLHFSCSYLFVQFLIWLLWLLLILGGTFVLIINPLCTWWDIGNS